MAQLKEEMTELTRELAGVRDEVRALADELRVKIHLAGMEAKDAWRKVEPQVFEFERSVERAAQSTAAELRGMALDLKERMKKIRDAL